MIPREAVGARPCRSSALTTPSTAPPSGASASSAPPLSRPQPRAIAAPCTHAMARVHAIGPSAACTDGRWPRALRPPPR
jgi:hypothetical protein